MFGLTQCTIAIDMTQKVSMSSSYLFSTNGALVRNSAMANENAHLVAPHYCSAAHIVPTALRTFPIATPNIVVIDDYENAAEILDREGCDVYLDRLHVLSSLQSDATSPLSTWTLSPTMFGTVGMCMVSPQEDWNW
jgi:hypothetical protein